MPSTCEISQMRKDEGMSNAWIRIQSVKGVKGVWSIVWVGSLGIRRMQCS